MNDKRATRDKKEHSKKEQKTKKIFMLKPDNRDKVDAKTTYMKNTEVFEIDKIDVDNLRVSNKYSYVKKHESYKNYVFYEHNNEYILLKIILSNVVLSNKLKDIDAKGMSFERSGKVEDNIYDIFENIKEKSSIYSINYDECV